MSQRPCPIPCALRCKDWVTGIGVVSFTLLFLIVARAQAQDGEHTTNTGTAGGVNEEASRAFWLGKDHYDAGAFTQAAEQFRRAFALTGDPDLLYNIAQSHRKLGQCAPALENYRNFLRAAPGSPLAPQAEKQVSQLQSSCDVPVASPVLVASTGNQRDKSTPDVSSRDPSREETRISPDRSKETASSHPSRASQAWAFVALSGGVVAGGVAAGLEIWNQGRLDQWRNRDRNLAQGTASGESKANWLIRQEANDSLARSIWRVEYEALYLSIGAGALLATSAIVYLWRPTEKKQPRARTSPRIDIAVQPIGVGPHRNIVSILGTF